LPQQLNKFAARVRGLLARLSCPVPVDGGGVECGGD